MTSDRWQRAKEIFNSAVELSPDVREAYLAEICDGDLALRAEVEKLVNSYDTDFMETNDSEIGEANGRLEGNTIGRYKVLQLLGVGGMGEVYLANDSQLGRKVAIKFLNERYESNASNVERFIQEAKAASALNHPNILTIHEIGETDGSHFIVSEYVDGHRLRTVLENDRPDLSRTLNIAVQVAEALAAAHSARIVHRDVKPENIVIRKDGYAKVLDFGLAKLLPEPSSFIGLEDETVKQNQTAKGLILGTVNYMSPEQAKGEAVDARTDIFSLGVLIYEMITGRTPFTANSTSETFANLINRDPEQMSRYVSGVPDELQRIVSKMLRKDPDERYQTMKGLLVDLKLLRDNVTQETRLARTSSDGGDKATEVFPGTTDETPKTTVETQRQKSLWLRRLALAAIPVLLLGIFSGGWYWLRRAAEFQPQIKTLAVLPLKSLNSQEDVLGLGIADAVIRRLSQTGTLTVRPRSAVQRYLLEDTDALTAAKQLATDAVLEGSIQRDGDRLRVSVNLLRTSDGASLWADAFNMRMSDIFTIQDSVAQQVASRLQLQLDSAQQARLAKHTTSNPIAYEYYVKGLNSLDQRGFGPKAKPQIDATIDLFKKAVEADPNFALARATLAYAYIFKGLFIAPDEEESLARLAKEEMNRADSIDPQLAETHVARSWFLFSGYEGYQTEAAAREVILAQQLDPNVGHEPLGASYYHMGLDDLAEKEYIRALEIDPTSEYTANQFVLFYYYTARWDDYYAALQKYQPGEPPDSYYLIVKGRFAEAEKLIDQQVAQEPDATYHAVNRAMLFAAKGDNARAEEQNQIFIKSLDKRVPSYHHDVYAVATVYAVMGKTSEAVKWLRESAETGFSSYTTFERDPFLDRIRNTPEFIAFMAEMKQLYDKRRSEFH